MKRLLQAIQVPFRIRTTRHPSILKSFSAYGLIFRFTRPLYFVSIFFEFAFDTERLPFGPGCGRFSAAVCLSLWLYNGVTLWLPHWENGVYVTLFIYFVFTLTLFLSDSHTLTPPVLSLFVIFDVFLLLPSSVQMPSARQYLQSELKTIYSSDSVLSSDSTPVEKSDALMRRFTVSQALIQVILECKKSENRSMHKTDDFVEDDKDEFDPVLREIHRDVHSFLCCILNQVWTPPYEKTHVFNRFTSRIPMGRSVSFPNQSVPSANMTWSASPLGFSAAFSLPFISREAAPMQVCHSFDLRWRVWFIYL